MRKILLDLAPALLRPIHRGRGRQERVWVTVRGREKVVPNTKWNRGHEYQIQFVAKKSGVYQLVYSEHAPSMIATFSVLPR